ncbi:MAG: hypothetical protein ACQETE_08380 [Bacteroidota bacterium]
MMAKLDYGHWKQSGLQKWVLFSIGGGTIDRLLHDWAIQRGSMNG